MTTSFGLTQYKKDMDKLDHVQQRTTEMVKSWSTCLVKSKGCGSWAHWAWKRGGCGVPAAACPYLQGGYWDDRTRLFTVVRGRRTWDNWHKLKLQGLRLDLRTASLWGQAMPQAVQRSSAMSFHAVFQAPTGYNPKEPALSSELTLPQAGGWTTEERRETAGDLEQCKVSEGAHSAQLNSSSSLLCLTQYITACCLETLTISRAIVSLLAWI